MPSDKTTAATADQPAEEAITPSAALSLGELGVSFDAASGYFMDEAEKDAIVNQDVNFLITGIDYELVAKFGPRFIVTIVPADDPTATPRGWQFSAAERNAQTGKPQVAVIQRNAQFHALKALQDQAGGRPVGPVRFIERGQFRTIEDAVAVPFAESKGVTSEKDALGF